MRTNITRALLVITTLATGMVIPSAAHATTRPMPTPTPVSVHRDNVAPAGSYYACFWFTGIRTNIGVIPILRTQESQAIADCNPALHRNMIGKLRIVSRLP